MSLGDLNIMFAIEVRRLALRRARQELALWAWTVLMLSITTATLALAQPAHNHPPQDAELHDKFYSTWYKPQLRGENGERYSSCCNKHDCYPTDFKKVGGSWFARRREDGMWMPVPADRLEHNYVDGRETPDGRGHVCANAPVTAEDGSGSGTSFIHCAVIGDPEI